MTELHQLFAAQGLRLTTPRQAVFDALRIANQPLYIHQLVAALPATDRTSIYRTLDLFSTLGIIEVIHTGFKKRYELAGPFQDHHHHLQCTACHALVPINSPQLESLIARTATQHGYRLSHHHVELQGLCPACRP